MKKAIVVALMMASGVAFAGSPRCAGSYEPAKCEALEAKLAAETPAQKQERIAKLEASRQSSMKQAASQPITVPKVSCMYAQKQAYVGMSWEENVHCGWGRPDRINKTINALGTSEQWVYGIGNYLYFTNGVLTTIHSRN